MMILCCKVASSHGKYALGLLADGVFLSPRTHVSETPAVPNKPASSPRWPAHNSRAVQHFRVHTHCGAVRTWEGFPRRCLLPSLSGSLRGFAQCTSLRKMWEMSTCASASISVLLSVISLGNKSSCSLLVWPGARAQWPVWHTQYRSACRDSPLDKQTSVDLQMPVEVKPDVLGSSFTVTHSPVPACSSLLITNRVMAERKVMWAVPARVVPGTDGAFLPFGWPAAQRPCRRTYWMQGRCSSTSLVLCSVASRGVSNML